MFLLQLDNYVKDYDYNYFDIINIQINNTLILDPILDADLLEEKEWYDNLELYEQGEAVVDYTMSNEYFIKERKNRDYIPNSFTIHKFLVGDILEFAYFYKSAALTFSGICIAIKKKSFILPDMALILRNIIIKTGMEITYSYFYNRAYKQKFLDYKRKIFTYNKNKLYFIRDRVNRESRVN